jgi:hypothetical protein
LFLTIGREEVPVVDGETENVLLDVPDEKLHAGIPVGARACTMHRTADLIVPAAKIYSSQKQIYYFFRLKERGLRGS